MSRCDIYDATPEGQRCVLPEGHRGPHRDRDGLEFYEAEGDAEY